MFDLSLVDTLRMSFGQVVHHHKAHTQAARALVRTNRAFRAAETVLLMGVLITSVTASAGKVFPYTIVSAVLAAFALGLFLVHVMFDFDSTARAHHAFATRLWHIREQYRALLSDINDDALDQDTARSRRNALMNELHAIYQSAPPLGRRIFAASTKNADTAEETALTDAEIDRFLPKSLHGTRKSA
jgi:hypothetical protein